ncbi:discoidin domain-containing protein [Blastopirellula marina]|uniref:F5/8 type C domain-containing protein n=1 Tax=Blastopirellula marina TaxID=124 RepID=A0A2S8GFY2_9BACT|nr:discoidin domain-containing protein [Blastopirellula marina]PQO43359.1 hypothetical protein C5Y98_00140 [Blastopirellula marina]PTL46673.1 hypothetical protein C5Y97_00140 [Blastopirellula marina]
MRTHALTLAAVILCSTTAMLAADDEAKPLPDNSNGLIKEFPGKLKFTCSSYWPTWGPEKAFDGNPVKSWFTARKDAAAFGTKPWVAVEFPQDVTVRRVTILANREPPWQIGYTILVGRLELLDAKGEVLFHRDDEVGGERMDMEVRPRKPIAGVRTVRFTSHKDEGDQNPYEDVAIGEMMVE